MSAVYRTKVARQLVDNWDLTRMPPELRILDIADPEDPEDPWLVVTFEDSEAEEDLDGKLVTPVFARNGENVILVGRVLQA